jgi:small-conductance mechanosensitive channel
MLRKLSSPSAVLFGLLVFNVIGIVLSEIQRRALVDESLRAQAKFQDSANQLAQRQNAWIEELAARTNKVEILTQTVPDSSAKINDIYMRLTDVQKAVEDLRKPNAPQ